MVTVYKDLFGMKYFILLVTSFLFIACNRVPSDPIKGADELYNCLQQYYETSDYEKASELMEEYLAKYKKEKKETKFFIELEFNMTNPINRDLRYFFIEGHDAGYPIFKEYMAYLISVSELQRQYGFK